MKNVGLFGRSENKDDTTYTKAMKVPQYAPSGVKPDITSLVDVSKYGKLVHDIKASNVTEEEKKFLMLAAARHIVFRYSTIADYYAHASAEMQKLMEQSALVILDFDDAIANGYVLLGDNIKNLLKQSGELAGSEK